MSEINTLSFYQPDVLTRLSAAGYRSVFDIVSRSRAGFLATLPDNDPEEACQIYQRARQRADTLKQIFRAWQLRQEPVIGSLKKLAPASPERPGEVLTRDLGGDGDFADLMARSSEYVDAASIQSLFSPGRYATSLYAVTQKLHDSGSALAIDQRRPDLKDLVLSETAMSQPVTALEILLDILQPGSDDALTPLATTFFPMNLPYDDHLHQINAALQAQGRTLNGVQAMLADSQRQAIQGQRFSPVAFRQPLSRRSAGKEKTAAAVNGKAFYLTAQNKQVWLANLTRGNALVSANLVLGEPAATNKAVAPLTFAIIAGKGNSHTPYLGLSAAVAFGSLELKDAWLTGTDSQQHDKRGRFVCLVNKNESGLTSGMHLPLTLTYNDDGTILLSTRQGYITVDESAGDANWKHPLVQDGSRENALRFTLSADSKGQEVINPASALPEPLLPPTAPNPPNRTTLALTPASYQLMVSTPAEADIASHYGMEDKKTRSTADLSAQLNDISLFSDKTGLTFNQILDLTAQFSYQQSGGKSGVSKHPMSCFHRYGQAITPEVSEYGAAFLNANLDSTVEDILLWVQPEKRDASGTVVTPTRLNFREDTVLSLAGNAEKLIRLHNTTGLSFEKLDWVIVNASRAVGYASPTLDSNVLRALAACVMLEQRYGVDPDTVVSFIGAVNPYARPKQKSRYETLFTSTDGTFTQILPGKIPTDGKGTDHELYTRQRALFCKAIGVTDDELSRILTCCGLKPGDAFDEGVAGQLYRFGAIPRMLGLNFAEAECLWQLMSNGDNTLLALLGKGYGFVALDLIARSEQVLAWMADNDLNLIQLQAMVSTRYSATATAEMFTFLQNVYHSVGGQSSATRGATQDPALRQQLLRALAGGFGIKTNVAGPLTDWLTSVADFTLTGYWAEISALFADAAKADVAALQQTPALVIATQRLSQFVLLVKWLNLSEQDLTLLTKTPAQLDGQLSTAPAPDLPLLLLLSRFKRWQTQVTASRDEALRLLPLLADSKAAAEAAEKIATLHNLAADTVLSLGTLLYGKAARPADFSQLWQLLSWARSGQLLNIGSLALNDLLTMAQTDAAAEDSTLIARVANNLTAGLSR
jgi:hypothetical protein